MPLVIPISIKDTVGLGKSISQIVDHNITGNKSLTTLSLTAGKTPPHSMLEFLNNYIGFTSTGSIDLSGIGTNTVSIQIKMTAIASQSWINCDSPPEGVAYGSYKKDSVEVLTASASESSASYPSNMDPSTTVTDTQTITGCISSTVLSIDYTVNNQVEYCGDGWGVVKLEILSVSTTSGPDLFSPDPVSYLWQTP